MKRFLLVIIVGLLLIILFSGCDKRKFDVPTDPSQISSKVADWVLAFEYVQIPLCKSYFYQVKLLSTRPIAADMYDDIVTLTLGDSSIVLSYSNLPDRDEGWYSTNGCLLGEEVHVTLKVNNTLILNTFINGIHKTSVAFPNTYDISEPMNVHWALDDYNQFQFANANSWDMSAVDMSQPYSSYSRKLTNDVGNHIFPANCVSLVDNSLDSTLFTYNIEQVDYKIVKKTAVMVYYNDDIAYFHGQSSDIKKPVHKSVMDLFRRISCR
jgi:hypothetical protein